MRMQVLSLAYLTSSLLLLLEAVANKHAVYLWLAVTIADFVYENWWGNFLLLFHEFLVTVGRDGGTQWSCILFHT